MGSGMKPELDKTTLEQDIPISMFNPLQTHTIQWWKNRCNSGTKNYGMWYLRIEMRCLYQIEEGCMNIQQKCLKINTFV